MSKEDVPCPLCEGAKNIYKRTLLYGSRLLVCSTCSLQFVHPFPPLAQNFYDQDYYRSWGMKENKLPEHVKRLKETNMSIHVRSIQKYAQSGSILEVGSATGSFLKVACEEGFEVTGLDLSHQACGLAQAEVPNAKILQGDLETVTFEPESFDVIFLSDLIEHIPRPANFWEMAIKLLKNNGFFYIITPDPEHWSCLLARDFWVHFKEEHLIFFSHKTFEWICAKYDLRFVAYTHTYKYTNLSYFSAQINQFGPKYLGWGVSLLNRVLPSKLTEYLFPLPLGEASLILRKMG